MKLQIKQKKEFLLDAAVEAIYWWEHDEAYYHKYFSRINELRLDQDLWEHFMIKIFDVFLNDYSVRRNIKKDIDPIQ